LEQVAEQLNSLVTRVPEVGVHWSTETFVRAVAVITSFKKQSLNEQLVIVLLVVIVAKLEPLESMFASDVQEMEINVVPTINPERTVVNTLLPVITLLSTISLSILAQDKPLTVEFSIVNVIAPVLDRKGIVTPEELVVVTSLITNTVLVVLAMLIADVNTIALTKLTVLAFSPSNEMSIPSGMVTCAENVYVPLLI